MNAPQRIEPALTYRTEHCHECGGSGVRMGASDNDIECFDCGGEGEWNACCAECREERELNTDGVCAECFWVIEPVGSDPFRDLAA